MIGSSARANHIILKGEAKSKVPDWGDKVVCMPMVNVLEWTPDWSAHKVGL